MVKRLIRFLNKETSSLHEAAYLLGFFAVLSQFLALIRDRLLAHTFGAGPSLDIYYAAFRIPDFIFISIGSVVAMSVLIPFIIERGRQGKEQEKKFIDNIFSFFCLLVSVSALVAFMLIPILTPIIFPGFSVEAAEELITLTRILLISPIALGLSNLFGSLMQVYNRFSIYALAPLLYNIGIIAGIVVLNPIFGIKGVVYGVVIGAILHLLVQVPFAYKIGLMPKFSKPDWRLVKEVVTPSLPRALTLSTTHLSIFFLIALASLMAVGSIAIFNFSFNLQSVPLTVVGVSYSMAAFPTLSKFFSEKNLTKFIDQMVDTTRHIIFWLFPITVLFIVLRAQIVRVVLGSGEFDWTATRLTAAAVALFMLSALFQSLILLFIRAFYSAGFTKKPLIINLVSMVIIIISSYTLVEVFYAEPAFRFFISALFRVEDLPGNVVLMLPLGFAFGTIINGLVYWIAFEQHFGSHVTRKDGYTSRVIKTALHSLGASVIMGFTTYWALAFFGTVFDLSTLLGIFLQGLTAGVIGIAVWILVLMVLKNRELREISRNLHTKFWKAPAIGPDAEVTPF